jgi:hypothetical protein
MLGLHGGRRITMNHALLTSHQMPLADSHARESSSNRERLNPSSG